MAQILRSKNLATKFQILLEVAANQPNIQQKDIALKLNITSQAVSEYVKELIKDGWLSSQGRSRYKVTREGVDWILKMARQLQSYSSFVSKVVSDISVSTAIAEGDLSGGQPVSLCMKDGLLFASPIMNDKVAGNITGLICDGGKGGCSLKLTTSASVAIQSALLAMRGVRVPSDNGIVGEKVEDTIRNIGRVCQAMNATDIEIVHIMADKSGLKF
ncbi:unnamed protein product [marine sediment metagenome]|uniref:Serine dehydratase-like alpha subunit domain-containing protein n=1 Tax=marine sediment metagenome TaxID=412755 RepID=X1QN70_9ZZZZ